jgi:hypothetical protein
VYTPVVGGGASVIGIVTSISTEGATTTVFNTSPSSPRYASYRFGTT